VALFSASEAPAFSPVLESVGLRKASPDTGGLSLDFRGGLSGRGVGSQCQRCRIKGTGDGLGFRVASVGFLGGHSFFIKRDGDGFEVLEFVGFTSDQVTLDLVLEAHVERGRDHFLVVEFRLEDELLESFDISANRSGLLQAGVETIAGLLL